MMKLRHRGAGRVARAARHAAALLGCALLAACSDAETRGAPCRADAGCRPNVLLILVDDLRPELGSFGAPHVVSPSIDRLAADGVAFDRAYVQAPVCGASRASLLTGIRPTRRRFVSFDTRVDVDAPDAITLPELLTAVGYTTVANGKILHWADDDVAAWSEPPWRSRPGNGDQRVYLTPESLAIEASAGRGPAYEAADVDDGAYPDGQLAEKSIADLRRLAAGDAPFFLAVGFWKPHLPFNAPRRYWDLYDRDRIPGPRAPGRPEGAPDAALHDSPELRGQYAGIPPGGTPIADELARTLTHGYLAALSYTDAQVGRLLDELDALGLADDTIVVLLGDHGFLLGDHGMWTKHANFDLALRTPLVIRAPGYARGARVPAIVEGLDVYPTIAELLGLAPPAALAGQSAVSLLADPSAPGKGFAASLWTSALAFDGGPWFGESLRTGRWLYTEWRNPDASLRARMLYDHAVDPGETVNVAEQVDPQLLRELEAELRAATEGS